MPESMVLLVTITFIVVVAGAGAFVRRISRDKCLKDFEQNMVTLEEASGQMHWGRLRVENTGLEFVYPAKRANDAGYNETSYILYRAEFPNILALVRFHDELSEQNRARRERQLSRTYHPNFWRRLGRKTKNVFKTIRDSIVEIINLLLAQAKKTGTAGRVLSGQDKYLTQVKEEVVSSVGTSFEPLLERHIGRIVVLELLRGEKIVPYAGVLKEYTAEFIELMDVAYRLDDADAPRTADLVVSRKHGIVRHLGE